MKSLTLSALVLAFASATTQAAAIEAVAAGQFDNLPLLTVSASTDPYAQQADGSSESVDLNQAQPIPEPQSYLLVLAGLGLVSMAARRKRVF